jgi:hypothetical protein
MAVFIEKSSVTSSNCYETIKTALILIKFGTNVYSTIAFVTACSMYLFDGMAQNIDHLFNNIS